MPDGEISTLFVRDMVGLDENLNQERGNGCTRQPAPSTAPPCTQIFHIQYEAKTAASNQVISIKRQVLEPTSRAREATL